MAAQDRARSRQVMKAQEQKFFGSFFQKRTFFLAVCLALAAAGLSGWLLLQPGAVAAQELPFADETLLLSAVAPQTRLFRFTPAPAIVVALFPSLHEQAVTLNRVAVFLEYRGAPRTRVLGDQELRAAIAAGREDFDDFYEGHDYRAADLARFFATADADGVNLNADERRLRAEVAQLRAAPAGFGALISLPCDAAGGLDRASRVAILRHELSHGLYFTDPAYASMVTLFWQTAMTAAERQGFRRFLGSGGYDETNDDLMRNEMQAYLINTRDRQFFVPALAGLSDAEADVLRRRFYVAMPAGWLKDRTMP
jgi:hypothetical protein